MAAMSIYGIPFQKSSLLDIISNFSWLGVFLGDVMGCGILFPPDYDSEADSDLSPDENSSPDFLSNEDHNDYDLSDSDDDLMWGGEGQDESGTKVQVSTLF